MDLKNSEQKSHPNQIKGPPTASSKGTAINTSTGHADRSVGSPETNP